MAIVDLYTNRDSMSDTIQYTQLCFSFYSQF
nr:MAG TPA: hypothetical protein [Caudoviricetes sp.]